MASNHQDSYVRTRDNPYFTGITRGNSITSDRASALDFRSISSWSKSRTTTDISDMRLRNVVSDTYEKATDILDSVSDINDELSDQSSSVSLAKMADTTSAFSRIHSDLGIGKDRTNNLTKESCHIADDTNEGCYALPGLVRPTLERTYSVNKRTPDLSQITLPQSAATFYDGVSFQMEIVESCESIDRLNMYLKARRDDVNAGVPGKFLHAVMGQDVSDVGSVASTIMYAFYLNEKLQGTYFCTVPVINMKRADLNFHAELKWLLQSCHIDQSSLIFVDEIDLSYYDLFGSLKLVLLNGPKLPIKQEALKEAVVEIFCCRKGESVYPWVETLTVGEDISCCTLVAEKFALSSPEILAGQGFSRLLLAGILIDTRNLTNTHCTSKDKYMATLLINGSGRFGCNGLYQILRYKMYDISKLKVGDILHKDFKKWTRVGKSDTAGSKLMVSHIGMSSIGISIGQLLAHEDHSTQDIIHFQQLEKLRLLMIVSGYYDTQKNFKREILVSAESGEVLKSLLFFFNLNASQLPLKVLSQPGLKDEMRAFEVDKVTSKKIIEQLFEEFGNSSKR